MYEEAENKNRGERSRFEKKNTLYQINSGIGWTRTRALMGSKA